MRLFPLSTYESLHIYLFQNFTVQSETHLPLLPLPTIIYFDVLFHRRSGRTFGGGPNCQRDLDENNLLQLINMTTVDSPCQVLHYLA